MVRRRRGFAAIGVRLRHELTGSAFQLGLVKEVQAIPFLLLSPIAGTAADRYDRKMQLANRLTTKRPLGVSLRSRARHARVEETWPTADQLCVTL
ncbi:MAG: hypothetical protein HW416_1560 [Chloroflexi bacterium]|nr:hypothetical protein [Chloroflexota bacterium]